MSTANLLNSNFDDESDEEDFNPQPQDASDAEDGGEDEDPNAQIRDEAAKTRVDEDDGSGDEDATNGRAQNDEEDDEEEEDEEDEDEEEIAVCIPWLRTIESWKILYTGCLSTWNGTISHLAGTQKKTC